MEMLTDGLEMRANRRNSTLHELSSQWVWGRVVLCTSMVLGFWIEGGENPD